MLKGLMVSQWFLLPEFLYDDAENFLSRSQLVDPVVALSRLASSFAARFCSSGLQLKIIKHQ